MIITVRRSLARNAAIAGIDCKTKILFKNSNEREDKEGKLGELYRRQQNQPTASQTLNIATPRTLSDNKKFSMHKITQLKRGVDKLQKLNYDSYLATLIYHTAIEVPKLLTKVCM